MMADTTSMDDRQWDYQIVDLVRAVDGDTFDLTLTKEMDFGFRLIEHKFWTTRFRLLEIDTWETNQAGGSAATRFANEWIMAALAEEVLRGQTRKTDHFGRWLIDLYRSDTGDRLCDVLREAGHEKARMVSA
jgi:endonuclease YncB( thermonuclease family)